MANRRVQLTHMATEEQKASQSDLCGVWWEGAVPLYGLQHMSIYLCVGVGVSVG